MHDLLMISATCTCINVLVENTPFADISYFISMGLCWYMKMQYAIIEKKAIYNVHQWTIIGFIKDLLNETTLICNRFIR